MTVAASPAQSVGTVTAVADATTPRPRTWWNTEELLAIVTRDAEQRGVRYYHQVFDRGIWPLYNALRKRHAQGEGTTSTRQLARDLYPDVGEDLEAWRRKRSSVQRWLALLERQGVIQTSELTGGGGKSLGLRVELLAVSEEVAALTRGCSSAGSSDRIRVPRRRLTPEQRCEARVRPWCPRAGQGSPGRFEKPVPLFYPERSGAPRGSGGGPVGASPPDPLERRAARARGGPGRASVDATERSEGEGATAALERRLTAALGRGGASTLRRAEEAFAAVLGPPAAGRLQHLPTIRELLWTLARLDRYGDRGQGRPDAGLDVLGRELEGQARGVRWDGEATPAHLGYFIPALRAEAKRWKHTWAPLIKRRRRQRRGGS